jgi:hypothetical protein
MKEITSNSHIQFLNLKQNYEDEIKIIGIENNSLKEESSILKKQNQDLFQQIEKLEKKISRFSIKQK